ncbi:MAG: methylated-DNA--[protein]-cysteine S-methyltransferase [Planctomycetota bacterium]
MNASIIEMDSPAGRLLLAAEGEQLTEIRFVPRSAHVPRDDHAPPSRVLSEAIRQLEAYFAGELRDFDLCVAPGGTAFQLATWQALRRIPYGRTVSYAELARRIHRPTAVRAVARANGRNPLPIVIPCHRVIGSGGSLTGYGGGLEIKRRLLEIEGAEPSFLHSPAS